MSNTPIIYVWYKQGGGKKPRDITIYAIAAEDGEILMRHVSSGKEHFLADSGVTSDFCHRKYERKYPDGNFLVKPIDDIGTCPDKKFRDAYSKFEKRLNEV